MKILIADDEELVRTGLIDILLKISPEAEISEAVNGRILIETVEKDEPDLCFADIRMPGISGLEAIEHLSGDHPGISWIILSGYSDFEYARKALNLGVIEYLLKPVTEEEVSSVLEKAVTKRLLSGQLKREKFEYRVSGVLNNSSAVEFDDYLIQIGRYAALVIIPEMKNSAFSLKFQKELFSAFRSRIDLVPPSEYAGFFIIPDGFPAVIAGGRKPGELLSRLQHECSGLLNNCRIVITQVNSSLQDLLACLESMAELNDFETDELSNESSDKTSKIVRNAEQLVHQLYNEPIGVSQIAEMLNLTPNYLSSIFKKHMDISFTKYITEIRLSEAPRILEAPGITVKEAATRLGYMSSRHFTRLFREKYGMPPSEYCRK